MAAFTEDRLSVKVAFFANTHLRRRYRIALANGREVLGRPRLVRFEDPFIVVVREDERYENIDLDQVVGFTLVAA